VEAYRKSDIAFVCNLTDESLNAVIKSSKSFKYVEIQDFEGQETRVVSSTRGTDPIFPCAEAIHLLGPNIEELALRKILRSAIKSLAELIFEHYNNVSLINVMLHYGQPFGNLRKLVVHN